MIRMQKNKSFGEKSDIRKNKKNAIIFTIRIRKKCWIIVGNFERMCVILNDRPDDECYRENA